MHRCSPVHFLLCGHFPAKFRPPCFAHSCQATRNDLSYSCSPFASWTRGFGVRSMNRRAVWVYRLLGAVCLTSVLFSYCAAQEESSEDEKRLEATRAKLYDEVAGLERQSNVLKLIVKLVRPTVVHIEAETTDAGGLRYNRK